MSDLTGEGEKSGESSRGGGGSRAPLRVPLENREKLWRGEIRKKAGEGKRRKFSGSGRLREELRDLQGQEERAKLGISE